MKPGQGTGTSIRSALVTGAAGMLGRVVCSELTSRDVPLTAATRADLDVTDSVAVAASFEEHRPDVVFHCAAWTDVDGAEGKAKLAQKVNGMGTANVVAAADAVGARVVHFSTDYVFDGSARQPIPTDASLGPISAYGRSKAAAEQAVTSSQGAHLILRTSWLYGPGGGNFVDGMVARAGLAELRIVSDQVGRPTRTRDLAAAAIDLAAAGQSGIFHVANQGECSWFELATTIFQWMGSTVDLKPVTTSEWGAPAPRPLYSVLELDATEKVLGAPMAHWMDALEAHLEETGVTFSRSG